MKSIQPPLPRLASLAIVALAGLSFAAEPDPALPDVPPGKAKPLALIDFESTAVGQVPPGFTKTGAVGVVEGVGHSGKRSLRMEAAVNGPRRITVKDEGLMKSLGGSHWGRLYYKVQLPTPEPTGDGKSVIHSTLVAGTAQSPSEKDPIEVRLLDTVMGPKGTFQYLYNVQPRSKRPEFGKGGEYKNKYADEWTLAEWHVDHATQTYRLFINGQEMKDVSFSKGAGKFEKAEIPAVFESLSFGWNNYQKAEKGFVAWIDDIALSKERIGEQGLPATRPAAKKRK